MGSCDSLSARGNGAGEAPFGSVESRRSFVPCEQAGWRPVAGGESIRPIHGCEVMNRFVGQRSDYLGSEPLVGKAGSGPNKLILLLIL
jgi:hypothetical protein